MTQKKLLSNSKEFLSFSRSSDFFFFFSSKVIDGYDIKLPVSTHQLFDVIKLSLG